MVSVKDNMKAGTWEQPRWVMIPSSVIKSVMERMADLQRPGRTQDEALGEVLRGNIAVPGVSGLESGLSHRLVGGPWSLFKRW